jgi:ribonucleoside-diphosphate reductase alpha chain
MEYLGKTDFVHVPPAAEDLTLNKRLGSQPVPSEEDVPVAAPQLNLPLEKAIGPKANGPSDKGKSILSAHLSTMMGDAPFCSDCGHTTVRNGSCYKCLNCGNSMGCS